MDCLQKFNDTFSEFISDLIVAFPDDAELHMYKAAISASMCLNDRLISRVFKKYVVAPYGEKLAAKDEAFFLEHTYDDVAGEDESTIALIEKIKGYWKDLKDDDRATVWKYFRVLILLSNRIA